MAGQAAEPAFVGMDEGEARQPKEAEEGVNGEQDEKPVSFEELHVTPPFILFSKSTQKVRLHYSIMISP